MTDAYFYDLTYSDKMITGLSQADETSPIRRVEIPILTFLECLRVLCILGDYDENLRNVYVSDSFEGTTHPAIEWVEWFLKDGDDRQIQDAMKMAFILYEEEKEKAAIAQLEKTAQWQAAMGL